MLWRYTLDLIAVPLSTMLDLQMSSVPVYKSKVNSLILHIARDLGPNLKHTITLFLHSTICDLYVSFYFVVPCPEISLSPSSSIIFADESVTFTCQAFSFGSIDYQWERDNNQIPSKAIIDVCSAALTIPSGSQSDEGLFCCSATNDCGTVKECAMLSVIGKMLVVGSIAGPVID